MTAATAASLRKDRTGRPFERVLIANRGEIAVRIIRACRELGVESVAVYSDADAEAAHVRLADDAVRLGPAPAGESYLRADRIIDAARETGSQAIHPGYGFLAERASFARSAEDAGIVFVGPSSATIELLGDKVQARRAATRANVPILPGTIDPFDVTAPDALESIRVAAQRIGFPLLVKAAAGGGGRGMRRVVSPAALEEALRAGAAEAAAAFGDGTVYLEREIHPARHVEVQLLGAADGSIVALGERDCSLQRRHQKLVEEAPAPGLTEDQRRGLHAAAIDAAAAVGLVNAATAEFLLDREGRFWFLEINTRLQVEHGVTELVHDVDIVREQLWIAAGAALSERVLAAAGAAARPVRPAIEVRISAEDPAEGFAPTPGLIGRWQMPDGPGVRVDTAVAAGSRVPAEYDPLIAKLMVVDETRPAAIDRLARALDETAIGGIQTTLPFHRFVATDPRFRDGPLSVDWVDTEWAAIAEARRHEALETAAVLAATAVGNGAGPAALGTSAPGAARRSDPGSRSAGSPWAAAGRAQAIDRWPR